MNNGRDDDSDYEELMRVLVDRFGVVGDGELIGPYSVHRYVKVGDLRLGIILDEPWFLSLFAADRSQQDDTCFIRAEASGGDELATAGQRGRTGPRP